MVRLEGREHCQQVQRALPCLAVTISLEDLSTPAAWFTAVSATAAIGAMLGRLAAYRIGGWKEECAGGA